jgi:hypothetical protein
MRRYVLFVGAGDVVLWLSDEVNRDLEALEDMADAFPTASQVLRGENGRGERSYHTSYLVWSDSRPFNRNAMLAGWAPVVAEMRRMKQLFKWALMSSTWQQFEALYASVLAAYERWRQMAVASMGVAAGVVTRGRGRWVAEGRSGD